MPYSPERQYREFAATEFVPVARETVVDEEGNEQPQEPTYSVRGYFTTFRDEYPLYPDFYESIDPHAFDECDMSDVIFQVNHEGFVYARTRNNTLEITVDDHGGHCVADLSGSKQGREDLYEAITNGLIDRMSFGFLIAEDGFEWEEDDEGVIHSRITKISKLFDVAAIAGFPANNATEISARAYLDGAIEAKQKQQEMLQRAEQERAEALSRRRRAAMALKLAQIR